MRYGTSHLPDLIPSWVTTGITALGADRAVVSFSGGNDEGDVTGIVLLKDSKEVADLDFEWLWDEEDEPERENPSRRLTRWLYNLPFDRFSFNGDPYISGQATVNTKSGKVEWNVHEDYD